jgi:hypothetical protein
MLSFVQVRSGTMDRKQFYLELSKVLAWPGAVVVIVVWFVFLAFLAGIHNWKPITDLITVLAWPLLVAVILLAFYRPLAAFIGGLGARVTKFSAFQISIELANASLPSPSSPWSADPSIPLGSELAGGTVVDTKYGNLFDRIKDVTLWDYLIVDIKDGKFWLISRVFIFTVFLQAMRGMKCIVFVETNGDSVLKLIGLASPDAVRRALSEKYDWFEKALSNAMHKKSIAFLSPSLDPGIAGEIIESFLKDKEMYKDSPPQPDEGWTLLRTRTGWERTEWLTREKLNEDLRKQVFYEWDSSHYKDTPDMQTEKRTRELLCRTAPFIALVNSKEEFQRLLDRQKLLEQIAPFLQNEQRTDVV